MEEPFVDLKLGGGFSTIQPPAEKVREKLENGEVRASTKRRAPPWRITFAFISRVVGSPPAPESVRRCWMRQSSSQKMSRRRFNEIYTIVRWIIDLTVCGVRLRVQVSRSWMDYNSVQVYYDFAQMWVQIVSRVLLEAVASHLGRTCLSERSKSPKYCLTV